MYFARKERTSTDYFLASRDIGWFFIGASLFVSNISTEHFIGLSGTGASSGLAVGHFEWLACLMLLILGWVFVPFYLRTNVFTMPEFLERRFNRQCAVYLAAISIIAYIFTKISVQLYAAASCLSGSLGWFIDHDRHRARHRDRNLHGSRWLGGRDLYRHSSNPYLDYRCRGPDRDRAGASGRTGTSAYDGPPGLLPHDQARK